MKCKWRHIRDNFLKYLNRGKSGDPAAKTKKYIYADALQFLLNTVEKRRTSGNIETTDSSETQGPSGNTVDEEEDHQVQPPSTSSGSGLQTPSRSASRQRQNERFTPFQSALLQKLDLTNTDQGDEDPDKIYILSLLSDYKKLNDDEKMDFKFLTLDFFRNAQRRRSSHYSGINTSMQNFPPSTQSSMYVFSQPGSRSTDFSDQLPPSSYPIQGHIQRHRQILCNHHSPCIIRHHRRHLVKCKYLRQYQHHRQLPCNHHRPCIDRRHHRHFFHCNVQTQ